MARNFTNAEENRLLDLHVTGVYVALLTAITDIEAGTVTEVTGGAYARQSAAFDAAALGVTQNTAEVAFPEATAAYPAPVIGWALADQVSGGTLRIIDYIRQPTVLGDATTQFDITNVGEIITYTWDTTGTDPVITGSNPTPGDPIVINIANASAVNNGTFEVVAADTNWFSIINPLGVAEGNKTIGAGSLTRKGTTTRTVNIGDNMRFKAATLIIRLD
jgi:hypothetical protein